MSETLPENWGRYELGEVVEIYDNERKPINNSERSSRIGNKEQSSLFPYYGATGQVGWIDDFLSNQESVLVGEDAAPFLDPIKNKAYLVKGKFWVNNHAHILRGITNFVNNRFILHQMNYVDYHDHVSGSTRLKLTKTALTRMPFLLCSYNEQIRIADKIDELFSELDSGIGELNAAQVKLTQYRHSLLKSAIDGALTQKWRNENKNSIEETGKQLLERILIERKERWEQQKLEEFKAKDKTPPKNWKEKYPVPVKPDTSNLPELPQGWVWASLDMIIANIEAGKSFKCLERPPVFDEYGVVKVSAVTWGEYNELESKTCTRPELENDKILIKEGDFLFSRANTTELVGACVIAKNITKKVMLSDKILRLRFVEDSLKYWILQFMRGELGRKQIEFSATGNQASMKNVSQGKLLKFAVPLPSLNEVEEIQGNLLSAFENTANAASEASTTLKILNAQRKNILKSAFSGELVPQDSSDEPASLLLDKIKKEREQLAKIAKPKRVKKVPTMNEITVNNLTKWLSNKKENSFTFEQIQKEFRGDYDLLKECIFEILSEKKPLIKQVFDQETSAIKFIKEDK
ncbi:restriction endonuclease subunit S [Psychromonas algicola]|uniref:restriction endonuclease subunit S n=1 Tax=Psychromonas algicola TaxID=2555642 RepID=UPI0010673D03|nr:restriction endonuclease subunit S [Psychromonas sp. RZ5]TEW52649.1 restriction endonuclease subunit S [Psychromonas sp. RZ5]